MKRPTKLSDMNGDMMSYLPKAVQSYSELRGVVRGTNASKAVETRKKVNMWYSETQFNITKLKRAQEQVYKLMLRTESEKRKIIMQC